MMVDVVVIGAGIAGLSCASSLQAQGYSVVVVEKSRGLGGRVATRRIDDMPFDYGARYVDATGHRTRALLNEIHRDATGRDLIGDKPMLEDECAKPSPLQPWPLHTFIADDDGSYSRQPTISGYVPKAGMTAIAKYFARNLDVIRQQRVQRLQPHFPTGWNIYVEGSSDVFISASAIIIAIPAPQVIPLLAPLASEGLSPDFLNTIQSVPFDPCITVTAGYTGHTVPSHPILGNDWDAVRFPAGQEISWIGVNRRKYSTQSVPLSEPSNDGSSDDGASNDGSSDDGHRNQRNDGDPMILVVHSSAGFARQYIDESDRQGVGDRLLAALSQQFRWPPDKPQWTHVHYWRYGFCTAPLEQPYLLTESPRLLGCAGDWCGGSQLEDALSSGDRLAHALHRSGICG
jgi:hypothetical protein